MKNSFKQSMMRFLNGVGSVLNLYPSVEMPKPKSPAEASADDWSAIGGDFRVVGNDMRKTMKTFEKTESLRS